MDHHTVDHDGIDHQALRRMTEEVDRAHLESMRTLHDDLGELHLGADETRSGASRRDFLVRAGAGGAAAVFGAGTLSLAALAPAAVAATEPELTAGDKAILEFAQGLELAAVLAYEAAIATNRLDAVVTETARTFAQHHSDHAAEIGTLAGKSAPNAANKQLLQLFEPDIAAAADQDAVLRTLFKLEQGAAATYQLALGTIEQPATAAPVSTILPVEGQHAVVWGQVLELPTSDWMPDFQNNADALDPARYATS